MAKLVCSANNKEAGRNARPKILWWALRDSNPEPRDYESIFKTECKCRNIKQSVDNIG